MCGVIIQQGGGGRGKRIVESCFDPGEQLHHLGNIVKRNMKFRKKSRVKNCAPYTVFKRYIAVNNIYIVYDITHKASLKLVAFFKDTIYVHVRPS